MTGYLHRHAILHLDLRPSNIVVGAGQACVLDLSHARSPGRCPREFGTDEYVSPEQLLGGQVTEASDVYGVAGVLYRAATRRRPFPRGTRNEDPDAIPPFRSVRRRALPQTPRRPRCRRPGSQPRTAPQRRSGNANAG